MVPLADFAQTLFPFFLVCQRIGVGAPEISDHLALRHEGTFGFGIAKSFFHLAQGEFRSGHDSGFVELLIQFVRSIVQSAPAFLICFAPKRRLRIEPRERRQPDANLPDGFGLVAHDRAEDFLELSVDD